MKIRTICYLSAIFCLTACGENKKAEQQKVIPVVTEIASASRPSDVNSYVGEVEPKTSIAVSFTGSGTVNKVLVTNGQRVEKGQLIAMMDSTQSKNSVMAAEAMLTQAQDAYDRMKILHDKKSLSDMDWVEVQSKLAQAESTVLMAKKMLADCNLTAPCAGIIGKKMMESGQVALPSQPVCTILDVSTVKVKISVPEKEIGNISDTVKSTIKVAAVNKSFAGGKIEKEIEADAISRTYAIRINVDNRQSQLLPGMVCDVALMLNTPTGLTANIYVPITAVQRNAGGEMFVWKDVDGKAKRSKVTLGKTYGERIAVTGGLNIGDKIIVKGCQKISENSLVSESNNK